MTQPASSIIPEKSWDLCIVGGGLTAWTTAALALSKGRSVLLLEKSGRYGGRSSHETRQGVVFGAGLALGDVAVWQRFGERLDLGLEWQSISNGGSVIHSPRGWQSSSEDVSAWEAFAAQAVTQVCIGGIPGFLQRVRQFCVSRGESFYAATEAPVEEIFAGDHGRVEKIVLGSGQVIPCKDVVWTADAKGFLEVIKGSGVPEEGVARVAWIKKATKSYLTPAVVLEFAHKNRVADFTESLLLPFTGADKEERRYLTGAFLSNRDPGLAPTGKQYSAWTFALNETEWDDNHETMKKIRAARRLLEKAFAGFDTTIVDERVLVMEHSFTPASKRKGEWKPLLENLFLIADWAAPTGAHWQGVLDLLEEQDAIFAAHSG
jgi:phytoene dehydrogenase-like protein